MQEEEVVISPFDHGFLYGMGIFETIRIYDGHPFLLYDHMQRLQNGLREMNIDAIVNTEKIEMILQELLMLNKIRNARVRINYSAGIGKAGLPDGSYSNPNLLIIINPLPEAKEFILEKRAYILRLRRNCSETKHRLKSHHFGNNIAAKMELMEYGKDAEGIFLTNQENVSEAITSNVFWVKNQVLYTPSENCDILLGITRNFILKLAELLHIPVKEGCYQVSELTDAEEIFLTNSVQEIMAIKEINNISSYEGVKGSVTTALYEQYKRLRTSLLTSDKIRDIEG